MLESVPAFAQAEESQHAQISQLIPKLGSDSFREREQAQRELLKIGRPAIPALKQADTTADAEVRWRVRQLLNQLIPKVFYTISQDGRLYQLTVSQKECQSQQIAKLGAPFDQPPCMRGRVSYIAPRQALCVRCLSNGPEGTQPSLPD